MATASPDLVLDIGNTRTKAALFSLGRPVRHGFLSSSPDALGSWLVAVRPNRIALACSGEVNAAFIAFLQRLAPVTRLTGQSPSPLQSAYTTPATLGVDRSANAVAAWAMFPKRASLSIDLGTCITYDVVDGSGTYCGGAISPGLRMRAEAMHTYTARLPNVEVAAVPLLGTDTVGALQSGVFNGVLAEVHGYSKTLRQQWPDLAVVVTGGDAPLVLAGLGTRIFADPLLTLRGLHALLEHQHALGAGPTGASR
ncbi:MAG: type III pantothenate kinase [Flavobacteriales bacterium]|nr:type III pantothenate kinase [Flavobacteriales bacterium]